MCTDRSGNNENGYNHLLMDVCVFHCNQLYVSEEKSILVMCGEGGVPLSHGGAFAFLEMKYNNLV